MNRRKRSENQPHPNTPRSGEKHVWFLDEMPKFRVNVPVIKSATLYLSTFMESKPNLAVLLNDLRQLGPEDRITLIFNSPGGLVSEGRAIINAIGQTGADIQTELLSEASSMAAIMFCIGDRRIIYENSSIMFHNFSGGFGGKGHELKDRLKHTIKNITAFFRGNIIGLTEDEIQQMIDGKDWWFCSKEMCERGIATHVNVDGVLIPAKRYLKALKKAKKKAKKQGVKVSSIAESLIFNIDVMSEIIEEQNKAMDNVTEIISDAVASNEFLYN
jgi:ATP-dependent protease ClpP protease subunit